MHIKIFSVLFLIEVSAGRVTRNSLFCWECENAESNQDCLLKGKSVKCKYNEDACQNHIRTHPDGRMTVTKRCKQSNACKNNYLQNVAPAWYPVQCNLNKPDMVCRCCCAKNNCNKALDCSTYYDNVGCTLIGIPYNGRRSCTDPVKNRPGSICTFSCNKGYKLVGHQRSRCIRDEIDGIYRYSHSVPFCLKITCPPISSGLEFRCTNGNLFSSICEFRCPFAQELYPNIPITCMASGKWNGDVPCCFKPCPPLNNADFVFILDSSSSIGEENWKLEVDFVEDFIMWFDQLNLKFIGFDLSSKIAAFRYNSIARVRDQILLHETSSTAQFLDRFQTIKSAYDFSEKGTNTGDALRHARDIVLRVGNRPGVKDIVILITDGTAPDEDLIKEMAADVRRTATVYAVGIDLKDNQNARRQLLDITGNPDRIIYTQSGFSSLGGKFAEDLANVLCKKTCS